MSTSSAQPVEVPATALGRAAWFATIAGLCASLVSIGFARFAYTPLIPPLIEAHWFSAADTVTLGAANYAGYFAGALLGRPMAAALSNRQALRILMVVASLAFFACAYPLSVSWFFVWRFLSGVSGGAIMVLVATTILPHVPAARRGFVSGMIFLGLGLGVAASGTIIPELLRFGLWETWMGLGTVSLVLTAVSWFGWPDAVPPAPSVTASGTIGDHQSPAQKTALRVLYAQYAVNALGLVPVMILLADYVARGLGRGAHVGALYWILYGVSAIGGPLVAGRIGDIIGFRQTYRAALLAQAVATAALAASGNPVVIGLATVVLGMFTPGVVPVALGRINEILPHRHHAQRVAWSWATSAFALFQALAGYGYAFLFSHSGENYALIFMCGAVALIVALLLDLLARGEMAA
ncbi:YbfB/YjiJ family MFS transporter [Roseiarcaceae bacterium H3SJ34-1]|uniref:YbfB/YjiJ family MFS transporter n=1 Tax=Terripilifer ovatus TaxID=3032367 RepID=UPI003AB990DE|nr:YbfB/YjiJ family MFS transporter [Roseiarcaceae bacterium H3SJ34-1]